MYRMTWQLQNKQEGRVIGRHIPSHDSYVKAIIGRFGDKHEYSYRHLDYRRISKYEAN